MKLRIQDKIDRFFEEAAMNAADVVVLVEDVDDELFWREVLEVSLPNQKFDFPYMPAGATGKDQLLRDFAPHLSQKLLLCVDADNEPLITGKYAGHFQQRQKHIFHTHSRENHFIYPENLETELTTETKIKYDFGSDFRALSEAVHGWLMFWLFCSEQEQAWLKSKIDNMKALLAWGRLRGSVEKAIKQSKLKEAEGIDQAQAFIREIKISVDDDLAEVFEVFKASGYGYLKEEIAKFAQKCPVKPEGSLFYIQGHTAFDHIVLPYFQQIHRILAIQNRDAATSNEERNKWHNISQKDCRDILKRSWRTCLQSNRRCHFIEKIKADISLDFQPEQS